MTPASGSAHNYHEDTKYSEERLRDSGSPLDWSKQPKSYKEYAGKERISLSRFLHFQPNFLEAADSFLPAPGEDEMRSAMARLSRLLHCAGGVTAFYQFDDGSRHFLRATPSAGALYPTEIYVAIRHIPGITDGIYNYQVQTHSLALHWEGDFWDDIRDASFGHELISQSQICLILTGVYFRSSWRYKERAYRRILLDTGHLIGNIMAYAPEENWIPCPIAGFQDEALLNTLMLNSVEEGALLLIPLVQRPIDMAGVRKHALYSSAGKPGAGSSMLELHRSSCIDTSDLEPISHSPDFSKKENLFKDQEEIKLPPSSAFPEGSLSNSILRRRSTRKFSGAPCSLEQFSSILKFAYQPSNLDLADMNAPYSFLDPSLLETYLIVQNVKGLEPGVYHYSPAKHSLKMAHPGNFTQESFYCCLWQELGRDACALVVHTCNLEAAVAKYGDRAYRYMHLDAGHFGQRLSLAGISLGVGSSGIGGFFDDDVNNLLGLGKKHIIVYITTLGTPDEK